jgi:hypothetical protein
MKKILLISVMIVALSAGYSIAQMSGGMMGGYQQPANPYQYQQQCPYQGGRGMMGGMGMMGPGMMGPGMMGGGMMGGYQQQYPNQYQQQYPYQGGRGTGYGSSPDYGNDTEKYQKFLDDTTKLRKELYDRRFEYFEIVRNPDTKKETISKLEKEIQELQKKIYEKAPR